MKLKLALCAQAAALCVLLGAIPAGASTIEIGLATSLGGTITTEATGTTGAVWGGTYDNYLFNLIQASNPTSTNLTSGTIDLTLPASLGGSKDPIYIYVTETGLTSSQAALNFQSSFDVENLPSGWTETERTYVDSSDQAYGTGTQLSSMNGSAGSKTANTNGLDVGSTFSVTELYEIVSNGIAGIDISSEGIAISPGSIQAAPAPSIGSGIPGLLAVGGVLLGWKLFERRRQA